MLVSSKILLEKAKKRGYAVGAFNVYNVETLQAVIRAAEKLKSPVIVQTSESAIRYAGLVTLAEMVKIAAWRTKIPVALHLDHGKDIPLIKKCVKIGYTSIMIDASSLPFEKNIAFTKKVVKIAHARRASVEAEIGTLSGKEDNVMSEGIGYTDPEQARAFARATHCDALAIAIGTSHGSFKPSARKLRFDILKEVRKKVNIPLVLHGASLVDPTLLRNAKSSGISFKKTQGVRSADIKKAIRLGICKINVDTDLRIAFTSALRSFTKKNPSDYNPRDILSSAEKAAEQSVMKHIKLFGSAGKA